MTADALAIRPLDAAPDATVILPGSKSLTNRALLAAALAAGTSTVSGALFSDDTEAMVEALRALGLTVEADRPGATVRVEGCDGAVPPAPAVVDVRQAGTVARFLPPMLALGRGPYVVDASPQMRARPMAGLVAALGRLGVDARGTGEGGGLPIEVHGGPVEGGALTVEGSQTSQFLSGLLLSAPYFAKGLDAHVDGPLVSRPYLDMTLATMGSFGVEARREGERRFVVPPGRYRATDFAVEPDATAASYFFAAAAVTGGRVRVDGLGRQSVQGDLGFVDVLERMGARVERGDTWTEVVGGPLHGVDVDLADLSDTAPTLAVVAALASGPTRISGIGFVRGKESDRIAAVVRELQRCGVGAEEHEDGLVVHPSAPRPAVVETYDDHRMAMAFAVLGLVVEGISVADPGCVAKTFPDFFATLDRLR